MVRRRRQAEPDSGERDLGPAADPESVARNIVLTKLTAQARSRQELEESLAAQLVPDVVAAKVLDRFEELGLVDDAAFADAWVRSRQTGRGLSRRGLAHELRGKGVAADVIRDSLDQIDEGAEHAAARCLVDKKLHSTRNMEVRARIRRLVAMLARKGYPSGLAFQVVREAIGEESALGAADGRSDETAAEQNGRRAAIPRRQARP